MILRQVRLAAIGCWLALAISSASAAGIESSAPAAWSADISEIRRLATLIPGPRATRINVEKVAESRRSKKFAVKGAADEPSVQARTAYQVVYPDGQIMIDSGMSQQIHQFFGRGTQEPYYADAAQRVQMGLRSARLILLTHEHGDHVGGIFDPVLADQFAAKTLATREQLQTLITSPQVPEIRLTEQTAKRFIMVDYAHYLPVAPGIVLIKAPGHTPGSQMIYVVLRSGAEYLFVGDTAWHMDGIRLLAPKDAPWLTEDNVALMAQLGWLASLEHSAGKLHVVVSHDEDQRRQLIGSRALGSRFE